MITRPSFLITRFLFSELSIHGFSILISPIFACNSLILISWITNGKRLQFNSDQFAPRYDEQSQDRPRNGIQPHLQLVLDPMPLASLVIRLQFPSNITRAHIAARPPWRKSGRAVYGENRTGDRIDHSAEKPCAIVEKIVRESRREITFIRTNYPSASGIEMSVRLHVYDLRYLG